MAERETTEELDNVAEDETTGINSKYQEYQHGSNLQGSTSANNLCQSEYAESEIQAPEQSSLAAVSNSTDILLGGITNGLVDPTQEENASEESLLTLEEIAYLKNRKEELDNLCDELMDERDATTKLLDEKDSELFRLRQLALETEQERRKLRNQLLQALEKTEEREKSLDTLNKENAKLRTEIDLLRKRVLELEATGSKANVNVEPHVNQNTAWTNESSADWSTAIESTSVSSGGEAVRKVETTSNQNDEICKEVKTNVLNAGAKETVKEDGVQRREAKRSSPNFYRHSLAGLPRPFRQSFDLFKDDGMTRERRGSFQSDTSGDSEAEVHTQAVPSFMRRRPDKPFLKSTGHSPVTFNYQPLPESIAGKRDSWTTALRTASVSKVENVQAKDSAAESSSDSESCVLSSSASTSASLEKNREESSAERLYDSSHGNAGNIDAEKRVDEKCESSSQSRSTPRPLSGQESYLHSQNAEDASHSHESSSSTREFHASEVVAPNAKESYGVDHCESQVDGGDEQESAGRDTDLAGVWNKESDAIDV